MDEHAAQAAAAAFEIGERGASLRAVKLAGATTLEAHDRLLQAGFRAHRLAIPGPRARDGSATWLASRGLTVAREEARREIVYVHGDGGVVRIFLDGGPLAGFDELSPEGGPFARRSLVEPGRVELGWDDEVAVITEEGGAVPKALRVDNGVAFESADPVGSYQEALAIFAEQRISLRPTTWPFPTLPIVASRGLGAGLTLVPKGDFYDAARMVEWTAREVGGVELRERADRDIVIFFAGHESVREQLEGSCPALASITIHLGANVIALDPFGYEGSVRLLVELMVLLLPRIAPFVAYENVTGKDVTDVLVRRPRVTLASANAAALAFSAR